MISFVQYLWVHLSKLLIDYLIFAFIINKF